MENFFRESGVKWLWGRIKTLLSTKQDKLVSGSNIKTINGTSVLGAGNITIEGGGTDKHGAAYPDGKTDKPYHKVASVSSAVNATLDTNISFYVSEYYNDTSCGILNISLRWTANSTNFKFNRIFWSLNVGIDVNNFVLGWTVIDGIVTCNLYVKRTSWTSYALKRLDEQAWGNPKDLWKCYNATYPNNCYATIPDANTVVSVNEIISNNVNTAKKLTTARIIALSGGAKGETSFDGSSNVNIPVVTLYDTCFEYKTLSNRNAEAKGLTLIDKVDAQFTANRLAFKRPDNILIEYSNDGGINWNTSSHTNETKVKLVSGIGTNLYLGNKTTGQTIQDKLRITIFAAKYGSDFYSTWQRLYVYLGTNGATGLQCTYEYSLRDTPDNWVSQGDWGMTGWSGWNKLSNVGSTAFGGTNSSSHPFAIRLTFWFEGHSSGYENKTSTCIYKLELRGTTVYGNYTRCKLAETGHMYDYDWQKNVTFPANVTAIKHITEGGTNQQVVLGDGSLKALSEISPITDADADILLDNHIHNIDVYANGNVVNISVIESSKNGNTWETEDNDIPIPLATTTSAGVMSKEDKIKSDGLLIYYHLTEDEYTNHELVSLYSLVLAIKDELFDSTTNKWKYDDSKSYDVRVKGWTLQDNGITYLNVNVRLLTSQGGHSIGFSGFADVDFITETYFDAIIPLYIGYICGKYHIENDGMTVVAPEDSGFYIEV